MEEVKVSQTYKTDMMTVAGQRSSIYRLLAAVYRQEPASDLLQSIKRPELLKALSDSGVEFEDDFLARHEGELLEVLAVEYTRLFLGPGRHISPHESVHFEREDGKQGGTLWGDSTVEVKKFIEATGLGYRPEFRGVPDHISVELEFMEELTRREEQAWSEEDEEGAQRCLSVERRFLEEHLTCWVPTFCDKIMAAAELSFYRELAVLTKKFIQFDWRELQGFEK
jgi:TorA maturation chaperone TorD